MKATGGDSVGNVSIGGTVYYRHVFTEHVNATLNDSGAALTAGSNVVGGVTVTDGMVVYVEDSSDPEQIGNTYQATGATDNWSWSLYGLTIYSSFTAQLLLVAGGGAGGGDSDAGPAGGGAGEVAWIDRSLSPGFLPARVGKGGIGTWRAGGSSGNDTVFGELGVVGGGGVTRLGNGLSGGSGGGGASYYSATSTGGASVASLGVGNAGGTGVYPSGTLTRAGGGGGGAGASGSDATLGVGGSGGAGIDMSANVGTDVGVNGWFGGGGGGASYRSTGVNGTGGAGGGGAAINTVARNGIANTGGGGGAYSSGAYGVGGHGGSGIIIVRYLSSSSIVAQLRRAHAGIRGMRA